MNDEVKSFSQLKKQVKEELNNLTPLGETPKKIEVSSEVVGLEKTETSEKLKPQVTDSKVFPIIQLGETEEDVEIVIVENNERLSTKALSMRDAFQEFSKVFTEAMNQKSVNSIAADTFGFLSTLEYIPTGMKREVYEFCNKMFYVQKNSSRESMIYDLVAKAARDCASDTFTFPFITSVDINIVVVPRQIERGIETAQTKTITIDTLTFTQDELKYMTFNFIKYVTLSYKKLSGNKYKDAVVKFVVDREILQVAPFSKSSKEG